MIVLLERKSLSRHAIRGRFPMRLTTLGLVNLQVIFL